MLLLSSIALAGPSTLMVGFDHPGRIDDIAAHGGHIRGCYPRARLCVIDYAPQTPLPIEAIQGISGVRYVEVDALIPHAQQSVPADAAGTSDCPDLWELAEIDAEGAWAVASGASAPVVAVADSGFLTSHEELSGRISGQYDYGNGDTNPEVEWSSGVPGHGTFIAGIIASDGSNGVGRVGIVPEGRVNLLKIADNNGALYFSYAVSALADIAEGDLGIRVVNYSIASSSGNSSFYDAVGALADADILMVVAAGNCSSANCSDADNDADPLYPSSYTYEHVVSVAGSTAGGGYNTYSHYGASSVDLAAPGVDICSLGVNSDADYSTAGGTSYAAPIVAGVAALLLEAHPDLTTTELARVLRASSAASPDWADRVRSGGVLDAAAALDTAVPRMDTPADTNLDGLGVLDVVLSNVGADGTGYLLIAHGEGFAITDAGDWDVLPYAAGDVLTLPDADTATMTGTGTLLTGDLLSHRTTALALNLSGLSKGSWPITARLTAVSDGAGYLNAPYDTGTTDETGFLALSATITVTALAPEDTGEPADSGDPVDSGEPVDTGELVVDSGEPTTPPEVEEEPQGCGCDAVSGSAAGWLVGVLLVGWRRR
ncbi:MAG: subtilisin family serine protease [Myxococcota bacterium]|jgi:subtilisin family serine protease